jgi:hypothetical protein
MRLINGTSIISADGTDWLARNDLHRFDPALLRWRELGPGRVVGTPPGPRLGPGMAAAGDSFFVLGGLEEDEGGRYGHHLAPSFPHTRSTHAPYLAGVCAWAYSPAPHRSLRPPALYFCLGIPAQQHPSPLVLPAFLPHDLFSLGS